MAAELAKWTTTEWMAAEVGKRITTEGMYRGW